MLNFKPPPPEKKKKRDRDDDDDPDFKEVRRKRSVLEAVSALAVVRNLDMRQDLGMQ